MACDGRRTGVEDAGSAVSSNANAANPSTHALYFSVVGSINPLVIDEEAGVDVGFALEVMAVEVMGECVRHFGV